MKAQMSNEEMLTCTYSYVYQVRNCNIMFYFDK